MFDHEKLQVYQLQLEFIRWVTPLTEEVQKKAAGKTAAVRKHLDESSLSTLLNIAEGNGKRQRQGRARSFDDARGSTTESAACLDALVAKDVCPRRRIEEGKGMLERVCAMLTKLVARFEQSLPSSSSSSSSSNQSKSRTRTSESDNDSGEG